MQCSHKTAATYKSSVLGKEWVTVICQINWEIVDSNIHLGSVKLTYCTIWYL